MHNLVYIWYKEFDVGESAFSKARRAAKIEIKKERAQAFVDGTGDWPANDIVPVKDIALLQRNGAFYIAQKTVVIEGIEYVCSGDQYVSTKDELKYPLWATILIGIALTLALVVPCIVFFATGQHIAPKKHISMDEVMKLSPTSFKELTKQEAQKFVQDNFESFALAWDMDYGELDRLATERVRQSKH